MTNTNPELSCVGLMSGTSVDGIDVAIVGISGVPLQLQVRLRYFETVSYEEEVRNRIFRFFRPETSSVIDVCEMNFLLGHVYADAILQTFRNSGIPSSEIAFISSQEAVAFAVLGYECFHRRPNNLPPATGAKHPVVMGKIVWS